MIYAWVQSEPTVVQWEWRAVQLGQACWMVVQDPCQTSKPVLVPMPEAWLCAGFAIAGHGEPGPNFLQSVGTARNTDRQRLLAHRGFHRLRLRTWTSGSLYPPTAPYELQH